MVHGPLMNQRLFRFSVHLGVFKMKSYSVYILYQLGPDANISWFDLTRTPHEPNRKTTVRADCIEEATATARRNFDPTAWKLPELPELDLSAIAASRVNVVNDGHLVSKLDKLEEIMDLYNSTGIAPKVGKPQYEFVDYVQRLSTKKTILKRSHKYTLLIKTATGCFVTVVCSVDAVMSIEEIE